MENDNKDLLDRLRKAEEIAAQYRAESAHYLNLLRQCLELAQQGMQTPDIAFFAAIKDKASVTTDTYPVEGRKILLDDFRIHSQWLTRAKNRLESIKLKANDIQAEKYSHNYKLKQAILSAAEDGLTMQL